MNSRTAKVLGYVSLVMLAALAGKYFYSSASVNELDWILGPTAMLVELCTGTMFEFEAHSGYLSREEMFLIAKACSGMNFLIAAFLLLSLGTLLRSKDRSPKWWWMPVSAVAAYVTTILANTVRISTALRLREVPAEAGFFSDAQAHRLEGIVIYFGFLLLLFFVSGLLADDRGSLSSRSGARAWRLFIPLLAYYATAFALPLANGAYRQGAVFWEHALFVLVTPALLLLPIAIIELWRLNRKRNRWNQLR